MTQDFKHYARTPVFVEMRPYVLGEDLTGIAFFGTDEPQVGDMIARDSVRHELQWMLTEAFFKRFYVQEPVDPGAIP